MDVILDSNIYRSDFFCRSNQFQALNDYLTKTNSSVLIPQVVLDEVLALYRKELIDKYLIVEKSLTSLKNILNSVIIGVLPEIDQDAVVEEYRETLLSSFSAFKILPYDNSLLPLISQRLIDKKKPGGSKGQGFRDTLIWLTAVHFLLNNDAKRLAFISQNTSDFAESSTRNLHEELHTECTDNHVQIDYFTSVGDFIQTKSTKIDFITFEWLENNLDSDDLTDQIFEKLNDDKSDLQYEVSNHFHDHVYDVYLHAVEVKLTDEFFVYEISDIKYVVNLIVDCGIDISALVYHFKYDDSTGEFIEHSMNMNSIVSISITINNKNIETIEINEIQFE